MRQTMDFVLKMMNLVLKMMNLALTMMDFVQARASCRPDLGAIFILMFDCCSSDFRLNFGLF